MQVDRFVRSGARYSSLVLCGGLLLATVAGCHRAPAPDVMATVNGKEISRAEVDKYFKASLGDAPQEPSAAEGDIRRLTILHGMIEDEIIQQKAAKLNLVASDEDVNAKLTEMKAPYTQEEFDRQLKARNITLDDLKRDLRKQLTKTKLLNKEVESKINITDGAISSYFQAHKAEFNLIEPQYHLSQIVVTSQPAQQAGNLQNNKATNEADAKKKIDALHQKLQSGEDFGAVAMNFSENPNTASNGGDLGFVAESQLKSDQSAYEAISKLKPGEITPVLTIYADGKHPIGYVIYKLISHEPAGQRELNDPRVQQTIRQGLREGQTQLLRSAYFEMLEHEAKVHNYFADQILKNGVK